MNANILSGRVQESTVSQVDVPPRNLPKPPSSGSRRRTAILTIHSYPKHVWSPAGGWYCQPANWKRNTVIMTAGMFFQLAIIWKISAEREVWTRKPEPGEWYISR